MESYPFRHVVIDDYLPESLLRAVNAEWPGDESDHWYRYQCGKRATRDELRMPPAAREALSFVLATDLPRQIGIADAFGDWSLHGAGLHCMPRGSRLGVHLDAASHPAKPWERVASAVLFCNPTWREEWGGQLELWDDRQTRCVASIAPQFNRLVVFETTATSWHGVPAELTCPRSIERRTLAAFFWRESMVKAERDRASFAN